MMLSVAFFVVGGGDLFGLPWVGFLFFCLDVLGGVV